jgi:hypothetical protein
MPENIFSSIPSEEAALLLKLRKDATYPASVFARKVIRNLMTFHEITKETGSTLIRWTYCWM